MKKLFLISFIVLALNSLFAQTYNMSNTTVTTCSGTFYDSGGASGNYGSTQNLVMTFCPGTTGANLVFNFTTFNTESSYDVLKVFAGTGTGGALLFSGSGSQLNGTVVHGDQGQCITFQFTSDGSVQNSGWSATISCKFPCQDFLTFINSSNNITIDNNTIFSCDSSITLNAYTFFPNNYNYYTQHEDSMQYTWIINHDSTVINDTIQINNISECFRTVIELYAVDQNECSIYRTYNIFKESKPDVEIINNSSLILNINDTVSLTGNTVNDTCFFYYENEFFNNTTTFIPDDATGHYTTILDIFNFEQNSTINSTNYPRIWINMEHSYLGDLTITLSCPNNNTVKIIQYPNACGSTYLGVPIDDDANLSPGTGYDYYFANWSSSGSINTICGSFSTLPSDTYNTQTPFSNLDGCPVNGQWQLDIYDNISSDNGYIFGWGLIFDFIEPSIDTMIYYPTNSFWTNNYSNVSVLLSDQNNFNATFADTGSYTFYYNTSTDNCNYSTPVTVNVSGFINEKIINSENEYKIYPNPANEVLYIETIYDESLYIVSDVLGKNIKSDKLLIGNNKINTSELSPGIYSINIISGNNSFSKVFIKK